MKTILILMTFAYQFGISQARTYQEVSPKEVYKKEMSSPTTLDRTYKYGELLYSFGFVKQNARIIGIKVKVENKKQQVIFNTIVKNDGGYYWARFFKTDNIADGFLLFVDMTDDANGFSLGNWVYRIIGEKITPIGLLDVAIVSPQSLNNPVSIAGNTTIKTDGKTINFTFNTDNLIYKLDYTKKYRVIKGSTISYIYKNNKLSVETK